MIRVKSNHSVIRPRVPIICIISAVGIYFSITNPPIALVIFALNVASLFVFNEQEIFCEMLFLLSFTMIYKYTPAAASLFTYLSLIAVFRLLLAKRKIDTRIWISILIFVIFLLIGVGDATANFIKIVSNLLLFAFFAKVIKREMFPKLIISLSLGEVVSSFIGLQKNTWSALSLFFSSMKEEYINGEKMARFTGLYLDPNYFSIMVALSIFGILLFMYLKEISPRIGLPIFISLIVFGCLTYSRLFYLSMATIFVIIVVMRFKTGKYFSTILLAALFIVIFFTFADQYGIIDNIMYRFNAEDISNNRFNLWIDYLKAISSSGRILFFGVGLDGGFLNNIGSHNFYIECIYFLGCVGSILYFYTIGLIIRTRVQPLFKRHIINYSITVVTMAMFMTLGMLFQFDFIYIMMINWIFLNTNIKRV